MISVRVSFGEIDSEIAFESDAYSGEVIEDMCKRAAAVVIAVNTAAAVAEDT